VVCLSKLFSSVFDLLPLRSTWVCYLCVQGSLSYLWSSTKVTHQVWFVLEVKRSLKLFLQVLCGSPVWPVEGNILTGATCWAEPATGVTGDAWQFKFSGMKSFSRSSRIFTPFRRHQFKVLSGRGCSPSSAFACYPRSSYRFRLGKWYYDSMKLSGWMK
jgi:hypothetical protein